ncbi:MAG: hypothetical protein K9N48_07555 [Verrucomicrobia bacterium]|nr:hypothetical protein [Verrucomicrobiota bacterium]
MNQRTDYDGAWKEALEHYLQPLLEFCFPDVAANINWHKPIEFLDKELQALTRNSKLGKQRVDNAIEFRKQLVEYEQEKTMPYVTSIERLGRKEGLQEGMQKGRRSGLLEGRLEALRADIVEVLEVRFSSVPKELNAKVNGIADEQELRRLHRKAVLAPSIEEFEREI